MTTQPTPKHRADQSTPTRPVTQVAGKRRRSLGLTLSERLARRAS